MHAPVVSARARARASSLRARPLLPRGGRVTWCVVTWGRRYEELRAWGGAPHAGWGLGFERLVQFTTGIENIRDAIPVPRAAGRCKY